MRALSIPVLVQLLMLVSSVAYGRMSGDDVGHFAEPRSETKESQKPNMAMPVSMGQTPMQPSTYPKADHFPIPGGDNSDSQNPNHFGRHAVPDDSNRGSMRSRWQNGRQLPASQYDRTDQRPTDFYLGQGQGHQSHDYQSSGQSGRQFGGRSESTQEGDTLGSNYDIYGVHQQARPEYTSGSRYSNEDPYNRGYQGSGGVGDSRGSYQQQYPRQGQSSYVQDRDRERDYRPRQPQPYQPEPAEVSTGGRRYDNPPRYPSSAQNYDRPYERPNYS